MKTYTLAGLVAGATLLGGCASQSYNKSALGGFDKQLERPVAIETDLHAHRNLRAREKVSEQVVEAYRANSAQLDDILNNQSAMSSAQRLAHVRKQASLNNTLTEATPYLDQLRSLNDPNSVVLFQSDGVDTSYLNANLGKTKVHNSHSADRGIFESAQALSHLYESISVGLPKKELVKSTFIDSETGLTRTRFDDAQTQSNAYAMILDLGESNKPGAQYVVVLGGDKQEVQDVQVHHAAVEGFGFPRLQDKSKLGIREGGNLSLDQNASSPGTSIYAALTGIFSAAAGTPFSGVVSAGAVKGQAVYGGSYDLPNNPHATIVPIEAQSVEGKEYWQSLTNIINSVATESARRGKPITNVTGMQMDDVYTLVFSNNDLAHTYNATHNQDGSLIVTEQDGKHIILTPLFFSTGSSGGAGATSGGGFNGGPQGGI